MRATSLCLTAGCLLAAAALNAINARTWAGPIRANYEAAAADWARAGAGDQAAECRRMARSAVRVARFFNLAAGLFLLAGAASLAALAARHTTP